MTCSGRWMRCRFSYGRGHHWFADYWDFLIVNAELRKPRNSFLDPIQVATKIRVPLDYEQVPDSKASFGLNKRERNVFLHQPPGNGCSIDVGR